MSDQPDRKPARLYLVEGGADLMARIRQIAADTSKVFLTDHAVSRRIDRGDRDIGVVTILIDSELVVKTVEWEDWQ
ncbi:hypothetical protein [Brevundimonas vesicularis]|uniref:hypothetical protein n=1 Tax=Brevundimonas vesicularis TaxID=41276 RepID=UPI0038D4DB63